MNQNILNGFLKRADERGYSSSEAYALLKKLAESFPDVFDPALSESLHNAKPMPPGWAANQDPINAIKQGPVMNIPGLSPQPAPLGPVDNNTPLNLPQDDPIGKYFMSPGLASTVYPQAGSQPTTAPPAPESKNPNKMLALLAALGIPVGAAGGYALHRHNKDKDKQPA